MYLNMDICNFIRRFPPNFKIPSFQMRGQLLLCLTSVAVVLACLPANTDELVTATIHPHHISPHAAGKIANAIT